RLLHRDHLCRHRTAPQPRSVARTGGTDDQEHTPLRRLLAVRPATLWRMAGRGRRPAPRGESVDPGLGQAGTAGQQRIRSRHTAFRGRAGAAGTGQRPAGGGGRRLRSPTGGRLCPQPARALSDRPAVARARRALLDDTASFQLLSRRSHPRFARFRAAMQRAILPPPCVIFGGGLVRRRALFKAAGVAALFAGASSFPGARPAAAAPFWYDLFREWVPEIFRPLPEPPEHSTAIVIGSGFGASVAALRLARAGVRTTVLERGSRWPNDPWREIFTGDDLPDGRGFWHRT